MPRQNLPQVAERFQSLTKLSMVLLGMNKINRRQLIIGGVSVLVLVAVLVGFYFTKNSLWSSATQDVAMGEPVDVVLDFYTPWLNAVSSTSTDPYTLGYAKSPILSPELRKRLVATKGHAETEIDPVLCQITAPAKVTTRLVSELGDEVQILVVSKDTRETAQSVFSLTRLNEGWYIHDISCSAGEFGPVREFSFDMEGYLLKSVVAPLDPRNWHLVFTENGQPGHAAPLFFGAESMCSTFNTAPSVCDPSQLREALKAHVQGEMTETGVKVKLLQLIK